MRAEARKTGRTTRMLEEALRLAGEGYAVYVVVAPGDQRRVMDALTLLGKPRRGIKVETEAGLGNFDWQTMTLRGAWPNCVVLVDHYVIEQRFGAMLDMLRRFDEDPPPKIARMDSPVTLRAVGNLARTLKRAPALTMGDIERIEDKVKSGPPPDGEPSTREHHKLAGLSGETLTTEHTAIEAEQKRRYLEKVTACPGFEAETARRPSGPRCVHCGGRFKDHRKDGDP